jgi:hypothetical protein
MWGCPRAAGLSLFAIIVFQSNTLSAASFSPAPGQHCEIDLDTSDGHASGWRQKDLGSLSALHAKISIERLGQHPRSGPYFTVRVNTQGGAYGLRIRPSADSRRLSLESYYRANGKLDVVVFTFKRTVVVGEQIEVELSWKEGKLSVRVDNERSEIELPEPISEVEISSSTGEIRADVTLGNIR